jgi:L-fuconolactonase
MTTELPAIPIVDSHCHVSVRWFEPGETLLFQMDRCGVERAVIIGNLFEFDQSYQQEFFHAHEDRFASVVLIDPEQPDASDTLRRYVDDGAAGARLRAEDRSPGDDPYAIWRTAAELGVPVSCFGVNAAFASDDFQALLDEVPDVTIILENLAFVGSPQNTDAQRERAWALVRYPQLYIKVPALSSIAERELPYTSLYPFKRPIPPYLQSVYDIWGPERMMWGSDFPPVTGREGYAHALSYPRDEFADKPVDAQRQIFGATATKVFWPGSH